MKFEDLERLSRTVFVASLAISGAALIVAILSPKSMVKETAASLGSSVLVVSLFSGGYCFGLLTCKELYGRDSSTRLLPPFSDELETEYRCLYEVSNEAD